MSEIKTPQQTLPATVLRARHVGVAYGSEPYYELRKAGYSDSRPKGDITGMCIMVAPGARPLPGFAITQRWDGPAAPAAGGAS